MTACLRPCVLALVVLTLLLAGCPAPRTRLVEEPPPPERAAGEQWGCVFVDEARIGWLAPTEAEAPVTLYIGGGQRPSEARVSPDGRRVAVIAADLSIHVVELISLNDAVIADAVQGPEDRRHGLAWAPDSRRLVYLDDGNAHVAAAGGPDTVVDASGQVVEAAWSPDGTQIALCRRDDQQIDQGLWIVPAEAGEPRQVAPGSGNIYAAAFPAWSPDGAMIAFERAWEGGALCFVMADGTALRAEIGPAFGDLTWLADGSGVIYDAAANETETEGIAFCAPDREPRLLFDGEFSTFDALPTGDLAVISSKDFGAIRVTVIDDAPGAGTEGSARDLLGLSWADCRWRPDGEMLAVWSTDTEAGAPLLVGGRTGEFTRVADGVVDLVGWGRR